ncbi:sigma-54-dependent Fis family transcriptional regulator [Clostridium sp. DL1XJH146]
MVNLTTLDYNEVIGKMLQDRGIDTKEDFVKRGWKRCIELEVNPDSGKCLEKYEGERLEEILAENEELINFSYPFMGDLYSFVKGSGFVVVLTDSKFRILEVIGDLNILKDSAKKLNFVRGAVWHEKNVGNTAINTCIRERHPIQMTGDQHYCYTHKDWTCSAAPILFEDNLVGVLNVSGYADNIQLHTLGMVVAAVRAIQTKLEVEKVNSDLRLKNKFQDAIIKSVPEGMLTIDNKGILTFINVRGAEILGIDRGKAIGKHISQLLNFDAVILNVLKTQKGYIDKEFTIKTKYGQRLHFIKTAVVVRNENGELISVVETFKKIKKVHNLVNRMVGAYAKFSFDDIVGNSIQLKEAIRIAKIASKSSSNILVNGESGTGKELLVQSIHNASTRCNESFISINCAAIPSELIESELFGYEEGAFTGASKNGRPGKFELADGGTIFLDEIGEMPLHMQAKLLRVIQENQITRIGGTDFIDIDVRIISATNKDLLKESNEGNFRRDLFYRLNVLNIELPPLRKRTGDIKQLVYYFISKINDKLNKDITDISDEALQCLLEYQWPGNIRELENAIERAVNVCLTKRIEKCDLPIYIKENRKTLFNYNEAVNEEIDSIETEHIKTIEELEIEAIKKAIRIKSGNVTKAAKALNITRNTLYNKAKKYSLELN